MTTSLLCHCLIGAPGSGKTTLAKQWKSQWPQHLHISTDLIRKKLYGDEKEQGSWSEVQVGISEEIERAITQNRPIIYDATNAKRSWRLQFLREIAPPETTWIGWHLGTSLNQCKTHNRSRTQNVPAKVLEDYYHSLTAMPPIPAEGFAAVYEVPLYKGQFDFNAIKKQIEQLPKSIQQRECRYSKYILHPYSDLLAFEQLIYLISLLLQNPGAGTLQTHNPELLNKLLDPHISSPISDSLIEISQLIAKQYGTIYADKLALRQNLQWLETNGIVNTPYVQKTFELVTVSTKPTFALHRYSDQTPFIRLLHTIRYLAHHPFQTANEQSSIETLQQLMQTEKILNTNETDNLRKDIQLIYKPYGIMNPKSQRQGYFIGNAILSKTDLKTVLGCLEGSAKHLNDPIALNTYPTFRDRLHVLNIHHKEVHPVRMVLEQDLVQKDMLAFNSLSLGKSENTINLEDAIEVGQPIRLKRMKGFGSHENQESEEFDVLPLQIIFHHSKWYLAYQQKQDGLLRFERLMPLSWVCKVDSPDKNMQQKAYKNLLKLFKASFGLYLGNDADLQKQFLSKDNKDAINTIELWFTDSMFRFIAEGTNRFLNLKMSSLPTENFIYKSNQSKKIFTLQQTRDPVFANRMIANIPKWVLEEDFEFLKWLLGFGNKVKVIQPQLLINKLIDSINNIAEVYNPK
jgi:predicted kinase